MPDDKAVEDAGGPLFGMEIEELHSALLLDLLDGGLELLVAGPDYIEDQAHPVAQDGPYLMRDFKVHNFPNDLHGQVDSLLACILLHEVEQSWKHALDELVVELSLPMLHTDLEIRAYCYNEVQHCHRILIGIQILAQHLQRQPRFIHKPNNDSHHLPVQFEQGVALRAFNKGLKKSSKDGQFFLVCDRVGCRVPVFFYCVFQLNQGSLPDCQVLSLVVCDLHHDHAVLYDCNKSTLLLCHFRQRFGCCFQRVGVCHQGELQALQSFSIHGFSIIIIICSTISTLSYYLLIQYKEQDKPTQFHLQDSKLVGKVLQSNLRVDFYPSFVDVIHGLMSQLSLLIEFILLYYTDLFFCRFAVKLLGTFTFLLCLYLLFILTYFSSLVSIFNEIYWTVLKAFEYKQLHQRESLFFFALLCGKEFFIIVVIYSGSSQQQVCDLSGLLCCGASVRQVVFSVFLYPSGFGQVNFRKGFLLNFGVDCSVFFLFEWGCSQFLMRLFIF